MSSVIDLTSAEALLQQAVAAQRAGNFAQATNLFTELLMHDPQQPEAQHFLGLMDYQDGRIDEGIMRVEAAVRAKPNTADFLNNLGTMYLAKKRVTDALVTYTKAFGLAPSNLGIMTNLAIALGQANQRDEGLKLVAKVLEKQPRFSAALNAQGTMLRLNNDLQGALAAYEQQREIAPNDPESYYNCGVILQDLWRLDEAKAQYERAIALNPKIARYYVNHGAALLKLHDIVGAEVSYARSIQLDPSLAEAHYNYAICLFLLGKLEQGAVHYDWRLKVDETSLSKPRNMDVPMWDGSPQPDKTINLHSEQGLGDMLQFVRFAPLVAKLCKHVIIEVQKPLVALFTASFPQQTVIAKGDTPPAFDLHCPLMSLMPRLGMSLAKLPATGAPYLAVDAERVALWKQKLGNKPGRKIAINWQGNPKAKVDRGRSMQLNNLAAILALPNTRFISLQKNEGAEQIAALPAALRERIEVLGDEFDSGPGAFLDTIAVMKNCDLVITTDTAIAHVAGGIGMNTWLMLRKTPDWRWMLEGTSSPWYPNTKLFRQSVDGDWTNVIESMRQQLSQPSATDIALTLHRAVKLEEAEAAYKKALSEKPDDVTARHYLGVVAYQRGQADVAETHIRAALALQPDDMDALANLALALKAQGRLEEAVACCRSVLALNPQHGATHNNLGNLLKSLGRVTEALPHYEAAIKLAPDAPDLVHNLGIALLENNQLAEAEAPLRRAIELAPKNPDYRFDLARCLLMAGAWQEGWQEYEQRRHMKEFGAISVPQAPEWGGSINPTTTLLVLAEQGLGDTIQFGRFAAEARKRVGRVVLVTPPHLKALMATAPGVDAVYGYGEGLPTYDAYVMLPSLPHVLGITLETLPATTPYLKTRAEHLARWQEWRESIPGKLIGLNWQGNPKARADVGRSLHLTQLAMLGEVPGITFVALQKGAAVDQISELSGGFPLIAPPAPFDDGPDAFLDTAALMQVCDLVLTTDTSVAHLAGALARPTWVMLKHAPDWRWMLDRTDYPWYPGMRLFRQTAPGDWAGVIKAVQQALLTDAAKPVAPSLEATLAMHQRGKISEARTAYQAILAQEPSNLTAQHYLGVATYQLGDALAAEQILQQVVDSKPDYAEAWGNLALAFKNQQKIPQASEAFQKALSLTPNNADVHNNYGNLLTAEKKYDAAIAHYNTAISLQPNRADSYQNLGNALGDLERYDEAVEKYQRALALKPDYVAAMNGLGKAYRQQNKFDQAIAVFREATQVDTISPDAWSNMGVCYRELRQYDEALKCYDEAIKRNPNHAESYSNRALALHYSGDLAGAEVAYREALRLKPDRADAQFGLGAIMLTQGKWSEGFKQYEWRRKMADSGPLRTFEQPMWDGSVQPDKTLFLFAEQGLGDTLQFVRFVELARARVGKVIIEMQPGLCRLLKDSVGDAEVIGQGDAIPTFDLYSPLMSLPGLLDINEATLPAPRSYIVAEPERVKIWEAFLSGKPGLRIGLNWQGNPKAIVDKGRSIPLKLLAPLLEVPDTRFICLQKNAGIEQIAGLTPEQQARIEQLGEDFDAGKDAFIDTAAVMANLDLIITTDTAMAHLAGALGRPCWVLLKSMPDWRWMTVRTDSPWYPATRLFRQQREADWPAVVAEVEAALKEVLS